MRRPTRSTRSVRASGSGGSPSDPPRLEVALDRIARAAIGERDPEALRRAAASVIAREPLMTLEYVSLADTADGQELVSTLGGEDALASIAVRLGDVKLIDNVLLASD